MNVKKLILLAALPLFGVIIFYVFGTNSENYALTVEAKRKERIHFLFNSSGSPLAENKNYKHPGFFDADKKYRVTGKIDINPKTQIYAVPLSSGQAETYIRYGDIRFQLEGEEQTLTIFQHLDNRSDYIIPFGDATNGKSTYSAGRYIPVNYNGSEHIVLDFNLAENPYCAFNHNYTCPLPPKENLLSIAIPAGEKHSNSFMKAE